MCSSDVGRGEGELKTDHPFAPLFENPFMPNETNFLSRCFNASQAHSKLFKSIQTQSSGLGEKKIIYFPSAGLFGPIGTPLPPTPAAKLTLVQTKNRPKPTKK
jgi:hypothetical protein